MFFLMPISVLSLKSYNRRYFSFRFEKRHWISYKRWFRSKFTSYLHVTTRWCSALTFLIFSVFINLLVYYAWLPAAVREMSSCSSPEGHGWTCEDSFACPQIFVGHKLSRQFGLWPMMADDVELINSIQENFWDN